MKNHSGVKYNGIVFSFVAQLQNCEMKQIHTTDSVLLLAHLFCMITRLYLFSNSLNDTGGLAFPFVNGSEIDIKIY